MRAASKNLARKPQSLDFIPAAALPQSALTALTIVRAAHLRESQDVLIIGATGGVGLFVSQLANAQKARVIATGKSGDAEYLRSLGAEDVIDYTAADVVDQVRTRYHSGVDVVIDLVASGDALLRDADMVRDEGKIVSPLWGPESDKFPRGVNVHYIQMRAQQGDLDLLAGQAAAAELKVYTIPSSTPVESWSSVSVGMVRLMDNRKAKT